MSIDRRSFIAGLAFSPMAKALSVVPAAPLLVDILANEAAIAGWEFDPGDLEQCSIAVWHDDDGVWRLQSIAPLQSSP